MYWAEVCGRSLCSRHTNQHGGAHFFRSTHKMKGKVPPFASFPFWVIVELWGLRKKFQSGARCERTCVCVCVGMVQGAGQKPGQGKGLRCSLPTSWTGCPQGPYCSCSGFSSHAPPDLHFCGIRPISDKAVCTTYHFWQFLLLKSSWSKVSLYLVYTYIFIEQEFFFF